MDFNDTRHPLRQEVGLKFALASKVRGRKSFALTRGKRRGGSGGERKGNEVWVVGGG